MNEQEYIDATNLAKLRTATTIVRDCLAMRPGEDLLQKQILLNLSRWVDFLEPIVQTNR